MRRRGKVRMCFSTKVDAHGKFEDRGMAAIQMMTDDPDELVCLCVDWLIDEIVCGETMYNLVFNGGGHLYFADIEDRFLEFSRSNALLSLWCDSVSKTIDPTPLLSQFEYHKRDVYDKALEAYNAQPMPADLELAQDEWLVRQGCPSTDEPGRRIGSLPSNPNRPPRVDERNAARRVLNRIIAVAELDRCQRKGGNQTDDELVTIEEISEIVRLKRRSLERYARQWPPPAIPSRGSIPAKHYWPAVRRQLAEQLEDDSLLAVSIGALRRGRRTSPGHPQE